MTHANGDFWLDRLAETVENAVAARTDRTRAAYVELARHYRSMYKLTQRPAPRLAPARPAGSSAETRGLDFGSVHDLLMRAA
jgi:hypothetical protein